MIIYGSRVRIDYILNSGVALVRSTMASATMRGSAGLPAEVQEAIKNDPKMQDASAWQLGGYHSDLQQVDIESLLTKKERHELDSARRLFERYGKDSKALQDKYGTTDLLAIKLIVGRRLVGFTRLFAPTGIDPSGQLKIQITTTYEHAGTDGKEAYNTALECVALSRKDLKKKK